MRKRAAADDTPTTNDPEEKLLTARQTPLNLSANLNKTQIVSGNATPGFHCPECDVSLSDSLSYLDHINGRAHLAKLGTSMVVERATLLQVQTRFGELRGRVHERVREYDLEESVGKQVEIEAAEKARRKANKAERRRAAGVEIEAAARAGQDAQIEAMMGIGAFGSSRK